MCPVKKLSIEIQKVCDIISKIIWKKFFSEEVYYMKEEKFFNVAIIGAGNLGSRHMQALALTEIPLAVQVVDPSEKSLYIAKQRWDSMPNNCLVQSITFHKHIDELRDILDVVIVATSSKPRQSVVEYLLEKKQVKYLVLEKVLFPRLSDYDEIKRILVDKKVKTWVNCRRRDVLFYQKLRDIFKHEKSVTMSVSGADWGLGCNTIHWLDTYAFISDQKKFDFDAEKLDTACIPAKRGGYIEFTGSLRFKSKKGILLLTSYRSEISPDRRPSIITVQSENFYCLISESENCANLLNFHDDKWHWEKLVPDIKYQSQVTQKLVKRLIEFGECDLPTYEESAELHKVMLVGFLEQYKIFTGGDTELCPIT